jgi:hypothetical protein
MSYTVSEVNTIDSTIFESLFNASYDKMIAGTMDWGMLGQNLTTKALRMEAMRTRFDQTASADISNYKAILWEKDDTAIQYAIALIEPQQDETVVPLYLTYDYNLVGPDANDSRAWIYDADYVTASRTFFLDSYSVVGYKIGCIKNQSLYNYHTTKPAAPYYTVTETDTTIDGNILTTLKFTYS